MVCHYKNLPKWLQDNDFLHRGHRPPLPSFSACFKSIFRVHTETGNIWTHLLGCVAFIGVALYFLSRPSVEIQIQEKIIFGAFFAGAIICLGFSFAFHTLSCHSVEIGRLFSKWVERLLRNIITFRNHLCLNLLQIRLLWNCTTDYGFVCALVVLRILLSLPTQSYLFICGMRFGVAIDYRLTVG